MRAENAKPAPGCSVSAIAECRTALESRGVAVLDSVLESRVTEELVSGCDRLLLSGSGRRPGMRRVLERAPEIRERLRNSPVWALISEIAGANAKIVRAILFDKTAETNWSVPWHQDATIAVQEKIEAPGFGPWAVKDGEIHCQPPLEVMESIVTLRIHLDACGPSNGPLRVVCGSHRLGLLSEVQVVRIASDGEILEAVTDRGGVVVTTPLAIHSSPKAAIAARRRVLHLDCSAADLPHGLRWAEA